MNAGFTSSNAGLISKAGPHKNCLSIVHVFLSSVNLDKETPHNITSCYKKAAFLLEDHRCFQ